MKSERIESAVQILILLLIGGMAGAASFTHVHDWTMHNSPAGTGDWFGWANAVISELTPTAAGLEIRRRKRRHQPITYPMAVLIAAAALSLSAQVAEAKTSPTGWLIAAVPALAFLALSKLVLSRTTPTTTEEDTSCTPIPNGSGQPSETLPTPTTSASGTATPTGSSAPAAVASGPIASAASEPAEDISPHLITGARMAVFAHRQATGQAITVPGLADHLGITPQLAAGLLNVLGEPGDPADTPAPITHVNGTQHGSRL
ncbi:DUF2637 domain-containing protein [Actinoallomurus rhizosphaericola]|uniref:DUF2637 domain-containing protein n=1 Tax=Actinoallomurus rhizosphaericola TaxID=2952536 RepID=UPI002090F8E9|nr:DUF2637 domain-containing protein [Actinoallomurus rhizosphaericola]MCO5992668.1 DUF2637 domain-containing protein [Actinoallomurus rhizosphaericola]